MILRQMILPISRSCRLGFYIFFKEFMQVFLVVGDHIPVVLHFTITEWITDFNTTLLDLGLDQDAVKQQIVVTMSITLAHWVKNIVQSKSDKELVISHHWFIEEYVSEAVRIGYIEDEHHVMDTILKTIKNLLSV